MIVDHWVDGYQFGGVFYVWHGFVVVVKVVEYLVEVVDDVIGVWVGCDGAFDHVQCFVQFVLLFY